MQDFNEAIFKNNIFLNILSKHNKIMILSKRLIDPDKKEEKKEINEKIISLCYQFFKYINNKEAKYAITKSNYLKIFVTRIFYNYMELLIVNKKKNNNNDWNYLSRYDKCIEVIKDLDIKCNLIKKIKADYHFINDNIKEAGELYWEYNQNNDYYSIGGRYGQAMCIYLKGGRKEYNRQVINEINDLLETIEDNKFKKNYQSVYTNIKNLIKKLEY